MTRWLVYRTPAAEQDLIDIWLYVAADNTSAADNLLDRIAEKIALLADFPDAGAKRDDIAPDLRMLPIGNYVVLYRFTSRRIEIVRVTHGARDATVLF